MQTQEFEKFGEEIDHGGTSQPDATPNLNDAGLVAMDSSAKEEEPVTMRVDGKATLSRRNGIMRRIHESPFVSFPFDLFGGATERPSTDNDADCAVEVPKTSKARSGSIVGQMFKKLQGTAEDLSTKLSFSNSPTLPRVQRQDGLDLPRSADEDAVFTSTSYDGPFNKPVIAKKPQHLASSLDHRVVSDMNAGTKPLIAPKPRLSLPVTCEPNKSTLAMTGLKVPDGHRMRLSGSQVQRRQRNEDNESNDHCDGSFTDDVEDDFTDDEHDDDEEIYQNRISFEASESASSDTDRFLTSVQKIVKELWTTEKAYVARLHLISQDFHSALVNVNKPDQIINESGMQTIFGSVQTIYQFHDKFLLPELYECTVDGGEKKCIGEVMKKNAPFLKMYTTYMQNFNASFALIEKLKVQSVKFAKFMESFQQLPICRKLSIQNHMLEPVQRIPRYELLLKDYIRHLDDSSPDKSHADEALKQVSAIAVRCNETMKDMDSSMKLINILRNITGCDGLLSVGCSLEKEGRVLTLSKRSKEAREKYIYLLSDRLLLCRPTSVVVRTQFRLVAKMDLRGMKVLDGDEPHSFSIHSKQKFLFLRFGSSEEREEWQTAISKVILDHAQGPSGHIEALQPLEELDDWSPCWLNDNVTNVCMVCCVEMAKVNRRVHCRACGGVVCGDCASRKLALTFCDKSEKKVCDNCFAIIDRQRKADDNGNKRYRNKPILKLLADVPTTNEGFLLTCRDRTSWQKRWFRLHKDSVLCSYLDQKIPESAMFLSDYVLNLMPEITNDDVTTEFGAKHSFILSLGKKKAVYFRAQCHQDLVRWISTLQPLVNHVGR